MAGGSCYDRTIPQLLRLTNDGVVDDAQARIELTKEGRIRMLDDKAQETATQIGHFAGG